MSVSIVTYVSSVFERTLWNLGHPEADFGWKLKPDSVKYSIIYQRGYLRNVLMPLSNPETKCKKYMLKLVHASVEAYVPIL